MKIKPETGHVYYLKDFTSPKVFNGLYFECLLTDQKIRADEPVVKDLGKIDEWKFPIWKPERFGLNPLKYSGHD